MAFSAGELIRGAFFAWAVFTVTSIVPLVLARLVVGENALELLGSWFPLLVGYYAAIFAAGATIVGALAAWGVGHALRRQSRMLPHLLAHGALAAVIGVVTYGIFSVGATDRDDAIIWAAYTVWTVVAVLFGWWATQALGRRRDRRAGIGAYAAE